jgi:Mrp family chromosome partitioning ATPase
MNGAINPFQRLAWRVAEALPERDGGRAVLITSARRGEGRSYIAAALASALSEQTLGPVALCDCAWTHDSPVALEDMAPEPGTGLVASGAMDLAQFTPAAGGLIVNVPFCRGNLPALFHGPSVQRAIDLLRGHYGYLVIDGPLLDDCGPLSASTDGTLLVVNASRTRREIIKGGLQANPQIRDRMLGVVLNESPRYIPRWLYRRAF